MELYSVDRIEEDTVVLVKDGKTYNYTLTDFDFAVKEGMLLSKSPDGSFSYEKEETDRVKKELFKKQNSLFCN